MKRGLRSHNLCGEDEDGRIQDVSHEVRDGGSWLRGVVVINARLGVMETTCGGTLRVCLWRANVRPCAMLVCRAGVLEQKSATSWAMARTHVSVFGKS